jgi:hypothetical protein
MLSFELGATEGVLGDELLDGPSLGWLLAGGDSDGWTGLRSVLQT